LQKRTERISGIKSLIEVTANYAELVNLKSTGYLTHSDSNFYVLVGQIEISFVKHANSAYAFNETVEDFFANSFNVPVPCNLHKGEIVLDVLVSYVTM